MARSAVKPRPSPRSGDRRSSDALAAKRGRLVAAAIEVFAEHGYAGARVEVIAARAGVAKGSVFAHFGSKAGLFLAAYQASVRSFPRYLDAPPAVLAEGFFATLRYWLERTGHLVREDWLPYRVSLIGNYGADLDLKREINHWLAAEDPYATAALVRLGIERGEVRADIPLDMVVGVVDWLMEGFQDAQVTDALDPGLFRRSTADRDLEARRIDQFLALLRGAVGAPGSA